MRNGGRQLPYDNYHEIEAVSISHISIIPLLLDLTLVLAFIMSHVFVLKPFIAKILMNELTFVTHSHSFYFFITNEPSLGLYPA